MTDADRQQMLELKSHGWTNRQIAEQLDFGYETVRSFFLRYRKGETTNVTRRKMTATSFRRESVKEGEVGKDKKVFTLVLD